jgi:hypothetical protein
MFLLNKKSYLVFLMVSLGLLSHSVYAVDWAWQLENASIFESIIAIKQADGTIIRHNFQCDLTDALNEKTELSSTIETVTPTSHPDGVLVITCYRGANAEMIAIIDPLEGKVVYRKMGRYFVDWHLEEGKITIDYDKPCEDTKDKICSEDPDKRFVTVTQSWP